MVDLMLLFGVVALLLIAVGRGLGWLAQHQVAAKSGGSAAVLNAPPTADAPTSASRVVASAPASYATEDAPPARPAAPTYTPLTQQAAAGRVELHTLSAPVRQHTLIAARPGDGKTQTLNTLLCADVQAGCQAIVLNPQFTYYHPEDQPLDLRPLIGRFEVVRDEAAMPGLLQAIYKLGKEREPLYLDGQPVGHHISIIIDEWPRIVESDYGPACIDLVRRIVREMRKCNIWITLAAQDGQVDTLGFKSGVRASFATRLCGNVDVATWRALIGAGVPQTPVVKGTWATERGLAYVQRPTATDIQELVAQPAGLDTYAVLPVTTPPVSRPTLADDIAAWLDAQPSIASLSINDVCRGVGRDTGGDSWQSVRAALVALADDGHDGAAALLAARAKVK